MRHAAGMLSGKAWIIDDAASSLRHTLVSSHAKNANSTTINNGCFMLILI
ncbi:MAG: hypothetical protein IPH24_12195 [Crocinitomicaceae bacterium]|nr:hypothetical protein [Crocinitomicaceae bacterium]